jgi:acyl carrier protein
MERRRQIKKFVLENFLFSNDESALCDQDSMIRKGIVDSTGILELISHLEETFAIDVAEDEMVPANFESIDAITAFMDRKIPARAP